MAVLREIGLTVLGWIAALTALFVLFRPFVSNLAAELARSEATGTIGDYLPVGEGPFVDQWLAWLGAYLGGEYGQSITFTRPVADVVGEASTLSITLLAVMVTVTALLGALAFTIAVRLSDHDRRYLVVPAYALALLVPLVGLLFVLWLGTGLNVLPQSLTPPPESAGTIKFGLALVVSVVLALPIVGDVIRRVHRTGPEAGGGVDGRTLLDRGRHGFGTVECWTYVLYLASVLVVLERIFQFPGLGFMLVEAVFSQDYPLLFGVVVRVVSILVVLALVRNVGWVVVRHLSGDPRAPGSGGEPDGSSREHAPGSSVRDGRRAVGSSSSPTSGDLWRAVASRTKVKAAGGLFAVAGLLTVVSLATGPVDPQSLDRPPMPGITPTLLSQTTASILLGTIVALFLAVVLGALPGLLAGVADARGGRVPSFVAAVLRIPSEAAMLVPLAVAGVPWLIAYPPDAASPWIELAIGTIMGLVLAGFAFRAVYEAARDAAVPGRPTGDWITEALLAGGARLDFATATTAFVAAELVFIGLVPRSGDVYAGVVQLETAFRQGVFTLGDAPLAVLLLPILGAAPVVLALYLLGDGMGEALWSVRSGGTGPSGLPPSGGYNRHGYQPADGENDGGTHGQGRNEPRTGGTGPPGQRSAGSSATSGVEGRQSPDSR